MATPEPPEQLLANGDRLLALAEAQTLALAAQDVDAFVRVTSERDTLPLPVGGAVPAAQAPALRAVLERVAALDEVNLARARELLRATERELRRVREGQTALRGYGRPGAHLANQPTLLDQRG
jgi:hypothetical protein